MASILIVDDQSSMRLTLTVLLKKQGHAVSQATTGSEALTRLSTEVFDLVITDLMMEEVGGIDLLKRAKSSHPGIEVIVLTAFGSVESAVEAMKHGAFDYIAKPFEPEELLLQVDKALERQKLRAEVQRLRVEVDERYGFSGIVARSREMRKILDLVRRVAPTDSTVLIQGESGTGKELIARAIHEHSLRRGHTFIPVNCGALPETLLESELFGHVKGAFTGATMNKKGLFEEADEGTLFLDEIGEMSLPTQVKLLRAFQDGEIRHVGSNTPTRVNVRILAATNRRLETAVREKSFREDLYYRLQVIPVYLPPLRDHRDDILPLAEHFLEYYSARFQKPIKGLAREARQNLMSYHWPGNVRELENTIERATILCQGEWLQADDVDFMPAVAAPSEDADSLSLLEVDRRHIVNVLRRCGGDRKRTAAVLGISPATLERKIKKLHLDGDAATPRG